MSADHPAEAGLGPRTAAARAGDASRREAQDRLGRALGRRTPPCALSDDHLLDDVDAGRRAATVCRVRCWVVAECEGLADVIGAASGTWGGTYRGPSHRKTIKEEERS